MAVTIDLHFIDALSGGRKRFRRRFPKDVAEALGQSVFQVAMKARSGADLVREHSMLVKEFDQQVLKARARLAGVEKRSPVERWEDARDLAARMVEGAVGISEDEARELQADRVRDAGGDQLLYRALINPSEAPPPITMLDAKKIYRAENMAGAQGRNQSNRLERVCRRIEKTLGPLEELALVDLKREHARKLRDAMLATTKANGEPLSASSVRRELDMIRAMVEVAIREHDLRGKAHNPFVGLEIAKRNQAPETEWSKRDPLPRDVILAMRERMKGALREPALGLIWRLLECTGCRGAEIVGLRVEDVRLEAPYPHIRVEWHEDRRVKTKVSIRSVPLVGDAVDAAREALELAKGEKMLFPRYAYEGGPDAVSQALMKHLRRFTDNPRHVAYSLRHNMKDLLVQAGVPERIEHRILGHAQGGVGDRVYGGDEAKLKVASEAMQRAIALMP